MTDLITTLATPAGTESTAARDLRRPIARDQAQRSHDALFDPVDDSALSRTERLLIAAFATALTSDDATAEYYASRATEADPELAQAVLAAAQQSNVPGPYGVYAEQGLADESVEGLRFTADDDVFGPRLAAALEQAHLLVKRPREAAGAHHQRLLDAGISPDGIVTLSQLVSFLAFQQRVAFGLRTLIEGASA